MPAAFWFMIAVVGTAGVSFAAVVIWLATRSKMLEEQRRNDLVLRIMESGDSTPAVEFLREIERVEGSRARTKARVAGLISTAVGLALMAFLYMAVAGAPVYLVGLIPLLVGVALLIFSEVMMRPKG